MTIEDYLDRPYWVIDILPKQVPANSGGQYFRLEEYFRIHPRIDTLYVRFTNILLKLNCYVDVEVSTDGENMLHNPSSTDFEAMVSACLYEKTMLYIILPAADTMITLIGDDTYMTVYNPSEEILALLGALVASEGLFIWKP